MFYSQFILAKKGPLGTIWIAAHLERKLKKNQVADTDIGDSVDSILFPDVPIALRLSSHLLLGVVRIYSKKVNYLFHDCSEALLKVKQAFRSTAVDLPPEESTAPYHSITLPETFDLDDFVLPDSALLTGNFDDRHVSSREQITLQDTLDGTGYSTSRFGLDERFGDGDGQIALDLDEELLLDNNLTFQHDSVTDGAMHQGEPATDSQMDIDEDRNNEGSKELSELLSNDRGKHAMHQGEPATDSQMHIDEDRNNEGSKELSELLSNDRGKDATHQGEPATDSQMDIDEDRNNEGSKELSELLSNDRGKHLISDVQNVNINDYSSQRLVLNIQTPDLNEVFLPDHIEGPSGAHDMDMNPPSPEFNESANYPSTPGLLAEAILANSQELQASSPNAALEAIHQEVECPDATNGTFEHAASAHAELANHAQVVTSPTSVLAEPKPDSDNVHHEPKDLTEPASEAIGNHELDGLKSNLRTEDASHNGFICIEPNHQQVSKDISVISGMTYDINNVPLEDTRRISDLDQGHVKDANSYQTNNFSALNLDFHLRSCNSGFSQANLLSPGDSFIGKASGFSLTEQPYNLETAMADQEMHFSGSSMIFQGFPSDIGTDTNLGVQQKPNDVHLGHLNCFSCSGFSEPERMLFAPSGNVNLPNDLGQQTIEKGVTEFDGSVDRISNLSGQKHHLIENTPDLQNGIYPKISGVQRKKQNNDYLIPNDDDLLASILVGRRTPALRVEPTPPLPKPPSSKRPRLTQKAGLPKRRKVLLDDTIVLHADAIRQQLINTEDIRRMRKKAPCTRPEIWRIQKSSLEEDIFSESIFIGLSNELNSLLTRKYALVKSASDRINVQRSSGEAALIRDNDTRELATPSTALSERIDIEIHGPLSELMEAESSKNAVTTDTHEQLESPLDPISSAVDMGALGHSGNENEVPIDTRIEEKSDDRLADEEQNLLNKEFQTSHEIAELDNNLQHQAENLSNAVTPSITVEDMGVDIVNVNIKDQSDRFIAEAGLNFPEDSLTIIGYEKSSVPDMGVVCGEPAIDTSVIKESDAGIDEERPASEVTYGEKPNMGSHESERVPSAIAENSYMNVEGGLDMESNTAGLAATRESSDFCSAIDDIDADFLNSDDDAEYDEEMNDDVPNTEEAQSLENSGWSSRTRGVARYLKNLFDQESGHGRKSVAVDHLVAGKTRKEASRMFFETLVLKTRDYIHVEQDNPFDRINVEPRINLLKSDF